ncbi:MAG: Mov34/MPN/PAD-1 family protein [Promethearchaeota archaeon]
MPTIRIYPGVLSRILARAKHAGRIEIGGFLVGQVVGNQILIKGASFPRQSGTATHVTINDADMARLADELHRQGEGNVILGWWHTHPGMGAHFMSGTDIATQQRYQAIFPKAIAMIVDPLKFTRSLDIDDLDLHIYRAVKGDAKEYRYSLVHEPKEVIPDLTKLLLRLDATTHVVLEDTWFERMIRELIGEHVTTAEFTERLGQFIEVAVVFGIISIMLLLVILSIFSLAG